MKIFALTFALGVATGLCSSLDLGRIGRDIPALSAMCLEARWGQRESSHFFLEAGFLGVMLFGWESVSAKMHYFSTICVCLGAHFSAVWIVDCQLLDADPGGF